MLSKLSILDAVVAMRWEDILDIFMVALIIFYIFKLLRNTRSAQVLLGIGIVAFAYFLSVKFELLTLRFIISYFASNFMLVLVILFAADIRRGLAKAARFSFSKSNPEIVDAVNEVVRASFFMAEKRIGALIAFERGVSLGEYIEQGANISALVSDRLLLAIFNTASPLHDGAVIISGGRLTAASCFLPLQPAEVKASRFFGTRHRAAIGLSKETDALVVVVSEERGQVSLVKDGQVIAMMGAVNLRDKLLHSLGVAHNSSLNKSKG